MRLSELLEEIRDAAADALTALSKIHDPEITLAVIVLPFVIYFGLPPEGRLIALAWFALAVGVGIIIRVRRG